MADPTQSIVFPLFNTQTPATLGQWNLSKGVYQSKNNPEINSIVFFYEVASENEPSNNKTAIEQISDSGGRRLAVYEYPYRDGQSVQDLGRKGETFTFNIKFFGNSYQNRFNDFIRTVAQDKFGGTILHPIRGSISVRFQTWEFLHRHDEWNSVTIRAVFIEDQLDVVQSENEPTSQDSRIRTTLQTLIEARAAISSALTDVSRVLSLPAAIENAAKAQLEAITTQVSRILGQLGATYSSDAQLQQLAAQASVVGGSFANLSSGTVATSSTGSLSLPPVFQVGFDPATQAQIDSQTSSFVNASQVTPQQAVFSTNQARTAIKAAIDYINQNYGNLGYDMALQYRTMAVAIQQATEASVSQANSKVKLFTVNFPMSLRMAAKLNGLDYNRQNDIEALNPYLPSVNYIPAGTVLTVPAS